MSLSPDIVHALVTGEHGDPFSVLGPHLGPAGAVTVRAFLPEARRAAVVTADTGAPAHPLKPLHPAGLWEGRLPDGAPGLGPLRYRQRPPDARGKRRAIENPHRVPAANRDRRARGVTVSPDTQGARGGPKAVEYASESLARHRPRPGYR